MRHVTCFEKMSELYRMLGREENRPHGGKIGLDGRITLKRILKVIAWEHM